MTEFATTPEERVVFAPEVFQSLIDALRSRGYQVVGPRVRDNAIVYDELRSTDDLPIGWTDEQEAGNYRLKKRDDNAYFGYSVGPHSWKKYLYPPVTRLWQAKRGNGGFEIVSKAEAAPRYAFIGVRACELHAIAIQDRVFLHGPYSDPGYKARREHTFIVAVNCGQAGGTCFCASMGSGPQVTGCYDLALTEILASDCHYFLAQAGSERGAEVLAEIAHRPASEEEIAAAERVVQETARQMGRTMDTDGIKDLLYRNYEHPRWDAVAARCLTCGNCTMVCPTCFCTTVEDVTDLTGQYAERQRKWDSCFTMDFSYIHGGSIRQSAKARYRQWMMHKQATWIDQFGTSGCVGCGRCITWCPAAIDITEELRVIREGKSSEQNEDVNHDNHENA